MRTKLLPLLTLALTAAILGTPASVLLGQATTFTYQGRLTDDGSPVTGAYVFQFRLTDSEGAAAGEPIALEDVAVSEGVFTVSLDFGPGVFDGSDRWLEVAVRSSPSEAFTVLSPRQPVTSTPYAIRAANAAAAVTADSVTGSIDASQLSGTLAPALIGAGSIGSEMLADGAVGTAQLATGAIFRGTFEGNAQGLTNLRASALTDEPKLVGRTTAGAPVSVPAEMFDLVAIAGGWRWLFGIRSDGAVVGWNASTSALVEPAGFTEIVRIAITESHLLGLRSDGTVVAWPSGTAAHLQVPEGLSNVVEIAAGGAHSLALVEGGAVVGWGAGEASLVPEDLPPAIAVAAGGFGTTSGFSLALLTDGTVRGWGSSSSATPPANLSNVVAIAAGDGHGLALRGDGSVVAWGSQTATPAGLTGVVKIATADAWNIALRSDGSVVYWQGSTVVQPPELSPLVGVAPAEVAVTGTQGFALFPARAVPLARLDANQTFLGNHTFQGPATFAGGILGDTNFTGGNVGIGTNSPSERLHVAGNMRVEGLIRAGSETRTADAPNPAGLITRRVNSTTSALGSVVAIARAANGSEYRLVRDGTNGGMRVTFEAGAQLTVAAMGIDATGAARNFHQRVAGPSSSGHVQVYSNDNNFVHFQITFGDVTNTGNHLTTVTLTRTPGGEFWFGHMISSTNQ
jgi:hypothetical protein